MPTKSEMEILLLSIRESLKERALELEDEDLDDLVTEIEEELGLVPDGEDEPIIIADNDPDPDPDEDE